MINESYKNVPHVYYDFIFKDKVKWGYLIEGSLKRFAYKNIIFKNNISPNLKKRITKLKYFIKLFRKNMMLIWLFK